MYAQDKSSIALEELDIRQFMVLEKNDEEPLVKVQFSLDTTYLKQYFDLDLIISNLSEDNLERTEKLVHYVLKNFNKLFETGWTALYYDRCSVDAETAEHTLREFFEEQIDFEYPYYTIQLEINCDHLADGVARYCFVVATTRDAWMISGDNIRVYMKGNKACGFNTNNDDCQMLVSLENCKMYYELQNLTKEYEKMDQDGFQYADPFEE